MAKPKKGVIPPHLKKYLFKKGAARRTKKPAARRKVKTPLKRAVRRTAARRRVKKSFPKRAARRANPSLASRSMVKLVARKGTGPKMHYDGVKFTTNGRALGFTSDAAAQEMAQRMYDQYPVLRKGYRFFATPIHSPAGRSPKK